MWSSGFTDKDRIKEQNVSSEKLDGEAKTGLGGSDRVYTGCEPCLTDDPQEPPGALKLPMTCRFSPPALMVKGQLLL